MSIFAVPPETNLEETPAWIGGEGAVGTQAERHVRRRERNIRGLALTILGLSFMGGFALAGALCQLSRDKTRN